MDTSVINDRGSLVQSRAMTLPTSDWTNKIIDSVISSRSLPAVLNFRRQPAANKLIALENAVVQPRKSDTPSKVVALLEELVRMGAITKSEVGPLYSDLLIRIHRYNSSNVQANMQTLMNDIRAAQSETIRNTNVHVVANQSVLNAFLAGLPPTVQLGQHNYEALKQVLRLFVNEAPNVTVFKSGPSTMLQVNIQGVNTVNLDEAFRNLLPFLGVMTTSDAIPPAVTSRLTANARVLLLLLAPFTNHNTFTPDSVLAVLMELYRDTVAASLARPEATEREIEDTARQMGTSGLDLARTMGFLLKNREDAITLPRSLTPRQMDVLRFIQSSLFDRIDRNGEDPADALDNMRYSFSPSQYTENGAFIRRLLSYFRFALLHQPSYFREIYTNKYWVPPASFWTENYADFYAERSREQAVQEVRTRLPEISPLPPPTEPSEDSDDSVLDWVSEYATAPVARSVPETATSRSSSRLTSIPATDSGFNTDSILRAATIRKPSVPSTQSSTSLDFAFRNRARRVLGTEYAARSSDRIGQEIREPFVPVPAPRTKFPSPRSTTSSASSSTVTSLDSTNIYDRLRPKVGSQ